MQILQLQPIDQNPIVSVWMRQFPLGTRFSADMAARSVGLSHDVTIKLLHQLRLGLESCPEGPQLLINRGPRPGHRFVPGLQLEEDF